MGAEVRIYRGINGDGKSVAVVAGNPEGLLREAVEKFAGVPYGHPETGTAITPIAELTGIILDPTEDDRVLKYEEAILVDEEAERINDMICDLGLPIIRESAEEYIYKAEDNEDEVEERIVFAPVLEPNDGDDGTPLDPDKQKEIYSTEAVRKTAHYWMENGGVIGLMHRFDVSQDVTILETYIAPVNFTFEYDGSKYKVRKGVWLLMVRVNNDEMWKAIKEGKLGAFSVGGSAIKRKEKVLKNGD
ncbi:MAG: hypothetical protein GY841_15335 [FCB group bacterium]|nr:hypothetical protein [FCB group bacterium]